MNKEIFVTFVWPEEDIDWDDPDLKITITSTGPEPEHTTKSYSGDFVINLISLQIESMFKTLGLIDSFGIVQMDNPWDTEQS